MVTALFVYGSFRFGHDDFEVFDLSVEKTSGGILTGATMYVDPERNAPVIAMDNNPDGITGDIYYIDDNSWDPLIAEAESRMNQSLSFREVNLTDFETGEIVQASTWVLPTHQVGFFEAEAQIVPTGDWDVYYTDFLDELVAKEEEYQLSDDELALLDLHDPSDDWDDDWTPSSSPIYSGGLTTSTYKSSSSRKVGSSFTSKDRFRVEPGTKDSQYVWYIGYGSNLNEDRFLRYMNAGRYKDEEKFVAGDFESISVRIPHGVFFAKSGVWGSGGICFLDVDTEENFTSLVRAYRLTLEQFWSVASQESGVTPLTLKWDEIHESRYTIARKSGMYSRIVNFGTIKGEHVLTVTNPKGFDEMLMETKGTLASHYLAQGMINPPSHEYLNTIHQGVQQTQALAGIEIDRKEADAPSIHLKEALPTPGPPSAYQHAKVEA